LRGKEPVRDISGDFPSPRLHTHHTHSTAHPRAISVSVRITRIKALLTLDHLDASAPLFNIFYPGIISFFGPTPFSPSLCGPSLLLRFCLPCAVRRGRVFLAALGFLRGVFYLFTQPLSHYFPQSTVRACTLTTHASGQYHKYHIMNYTRVEWTTTGPNVLCINEIWRVSF